MDSTLRLLTDVLATYRLTKLVLEDELLAEVRDSLLDRFPPTTTKLGYLLTCPWCVSFWAGIGIFVLRRTAPAALVDVLSSALAASAVTGLAYERI